MNNKLFIQVAKEMFPPKDEYIAETGLFAQQQYNWTDVLRARQGMESPFMQQLRQQQDLENQQASHRLDFLRYMTVGMVPYLLRGIDDK